MEKTLYKFLLFFLISLSVIDSTLVVMASFFGSSFPQLAPLQGVLLLSLATVLIFLFLAWKKYTEQFGSK